MRKIMAKADFGYVNAFYKEEFEFDDDYTDEEIAEEIYDWATQFVCVDWWEEEKEND